MMCCNHPKRKAVYSIESWFANHPRKGLCKECSDALAPWMKQLRNGVVVKGESI